MLKKISISFLTVAFTLCCYAQEGDATYYGKKFDIKILEEHISDRLDILDVGYNSIQIKGEIISSCSKKGCWINMDLSLIHI